jgi:ATP-dependent Clp protease adaptor protein ClpS
MNQAPSSATLPRPSRTPAPPKPQRWNVVLLDDDDHSYEYVVDLMKRIFGHKVEDGIAIAKRVDTDGRAVCFTTHKELAELKQEQVHAFGRDPRLQKCAGSMTAIIEPADDDANG